MLRVGASWVGKAVWDGTELRAVGDVSCPAGAVGFSPAFQRREHRIKGYALHGRKIGDILTTVEYGIDYPLSGAHAGLRRMGRFPALKRRAFSLQCAG